MRRSAPLLAVLALAGCGKQIDLKAAPGMTPPVKPATAPVAPTVNQLITPGAEQRPARSDEPLTRSQPRGDDKFDLPPPG